MHWIFAALIMFISSVALYLTVRKSNLLQTPRELNNLAMFLVPTLVYLLISTQKPTNFTLQPIEYLIILIQAVFFSYLGNVFSLYGIELSPNPGYSLIISKSYVIFTAIASVFIFGSPLTIKSLFAILLIVIFSIFLVLGKRKNITATNHTWISYTLAAFFCWALNALSSKYLLNIGVPILSRLIYTMGIVTIINIGEIIYKKVKLSIISRNQLITLLLIGIFGASYAYFMQVGFNLAPNVGYINAISAGSISLLTLLSSIIFKDELNPKKLIGIIGVTLGLILLFMF